MFIHIHVCAHTQTCRQTDTQGHWNRYIIYSHTQVATPTKIHTDTHMYNMLNKGTQMLTLTWIYACMCMHLNIYTQTILHKQRHTHMPRYAPKMYTNTSVHICPLPRKARENTGLLQPSFSCRRSYWTLWAVFKVLRLTRLCCPGLHIIFPLTIFFCPDTLWS